MTMNDKRINENVQTTEPPILSLKILLNILVKIKIID
jgi:hypothetical protein